MDTEERLMVTMIHEEKWGKMANLGPGDSAELGHLCVADPGSTCPITWPPEPMAYGGTSSKDSSH